MKGRTPAELLARARDLICVVAYLLMAAALAAVALTAAAGVIALVVHGAWCAAGWLAEVLR